jgi:hypothetical protein
VAANIELLRLELHSAVDEIVDRMFGSPSEGPAAVADDEELLVVPGESFGSWTYRWPDQVEEGFASGQWYEVQSQSREPIVRVRLAWTTRKAWGRDRRRAIVFQQLGAEESNTYYPLTEFVETDDGRFASPIPNPERPRALLADGAQLPARFRDAAVERADGVFGSIENGPSLRLVLAEENETEMVRHGHWVARLRGRIQ